MPHVTYDDRSFMIDGRRIWLVSGEVHYFRIPPELWPDRLLKARRAGLNCIATPLPWSLHEAVEGRYDFAGPLDINEFIRRCGELGLYVILRAGPFTACDLDGGCLPAWLMAKSGLTARTSNAAFTHYFDRFYRQILPRLAPRQVSRGGNILAVAVEDRYEQSAMPDRLAYLEFIGQMVRRWGFDGPLLTNNLLTQPALATAVECCATRGDEIAQLRRLRAFQPTKPLLDLELTTGQASRWGQAPATTAGAPIARRAMEVLGSGGQFSYRLFCGGTNLGFLGGRYSDAPQQLTATSYDCDAPISEGGDLTDKYYALRPVNLLAGSMGPLLAHCSAEEHGASLAGQPTALNLAGPQGRWVVVTAGSRDDLPTADLELPSGDRLTVPLGELGAAAIALGVPLSNGVTLDYSNLTPLGLFGQTCLLLHGPARWPAQVSINGVVYQGPVPAGPEPTVLQAGPLTILLVSTSLAMRTWPVDGQIVFGADFVGPEPQDVRLPPTLKQYAVLDLESGKVTRRRAPATPQAKPSPLPKVAAWKPLAGTPEPVAGNLVWQSVKAPAAGEPGAGLPGYGWHRIELDSPRARKVALLPPSAQQRLTFFLNGRPAGVWGIGPDAQTTPIVMPLARGPNVLTLLADNMGRFCDGLRTNDTLTSVGHLYNTEPIKLARPRLEPLDSFPRRVIPRSLLHLADRLDRLKLQRLALNHKLSPVAPLWLSFRHLPCHVAVLCNDRAVGFFPNHGENFGHVAMGPELRTGKNQIELLLWGDVSADDLSDLHLYALTENLTEKARWSYRPWSPAPGKDAVKAGLPTWFSARFGPVGPGPLHLRLTGSLKGQLFLNGHNVGRVWSWGPHDLYYLPECYLRETNELLLFEEHGQAPQQAHLEYHPVAKGR